MENWNLSNGEKFKNALCYVPFWWIVLFFTENKKTNLLIKNIKYSTFLLIAYIVIHFLITWVLMLKVWWILFLIYAGITWFLWWKAYNWEDINIEYINEFEKKIKDNLNDDTIVNKTNTVKEEKKEEKKDDDILNF